MKISSYNLRYGGNTGEGNHLRRLLQQFGPDVICTQESLHPQHYFSDEEFSRFGGCIHAYVPHGKWGSAILSRHHALEPVSLPGLRGWVVGAKLQGVQIGGVARAITVFCIHAPSPGPYEAAVDRILDEIAKQLDGSSLILAGDFNITTALRHPSEVGLANTSGEVRILERLRREFGLVNAWQAIHPNQNLPQTLRWTGNPARPFHCDAIFVSCTLLSHATAAKIIQTADWQKMSDHNPILVEFA